MYIRYSTSDSLLDSTYQEKELGDMVKKWEKDSEDDLDPDQPFIIRLDGHKFSKFTKKFRKPSDQRLKETMIKTASALLKEFNAYTAFTASDEITLVFPSIPNPESNLIYNGRIQKLCSLTAGFASAQFNHYLRQQPEMERFLEQNYPANITAYFDARVFSTYNDLGAYQVVLWRHKYVTYRNGVSSLAQSVFSHRELQNKSVKEMKRMLLDKNIILNDCDPHLLYGTFIKKQLFEEKAFDRRDQKDVMARRTRIHRGNINLSNMSEEDGVNFVMAKYWDVIPVFSIF